MGPRVPLLSTMTSLLCLLAIQPQLAKAELVSSHRSVTPGSTFEVALKLTPEDGWHTYWKNPGDNGMPTLVKWTLPKGWVAGPLRYTIPETIEDSSGTSFGYSGEKLFSAKVTVPKGAKPGVVNIVGAASWMVCKELCMPGSAKVGLKVSVGKTNVPAAGASVLASQSWPAMAKGGSAHVSDKTWEVNLPASLPSKPLKRFFPSEPGTVDHGKPGEISEGILRVAASSFMAKAPSRFRGLIVFEDDSAFEIDVPVNAKGD